MLHDFGGVHVAGLLAPAFVDGLGVNVLLNLVADDASSFLAFEPANDPQRCQLDASASMAFG